MPARSNKENFLPPTVPLYPLSIATDFRCHRVDVTFKGRERYAAFLIQIQTRPSESLETHGIVERSEKGKFKKRRC